MNPSISQTHNTAAEPHWALLSPETQRTMAFLELRATAAEMPGQLVLQADGHRLANPAVEAAAQEVRATLLRALSEKSLTQIHMLTAMKRVRFWPQDQGNATMAAHVAGIVKEWMRLAFDFRVEDEESLDCLLHACARTLELDQTSDFGKFTNARNGHAMTHNLPHARREAMDVLVKWGVVPTTGSKS